MRNNHSALIVSLFLTLITLAIFWNVQNHEFVNFDDLKYITENPHVRYGLTSEAVTWAFTATHVSNWHPLTWLSHMLDCHLYGLNPKGHHFNNLLFHIANTLLLFLILNRMTGALWRSSFVAALFALHPLHVESVAWIAERKDVLSTFFWMLTMWAYVRYVERPGLNSYLLSLLFFAMGLMAKPMLVTLPFVLLLLDYWPLGRIQFGKSGDGKERWLALHLVREKLPFFFLAAISSVVTFSVQQTSGSVVSFIPLKARIANALLSYVGYITKMIWPHHLAVFYPHLVNDLPLWQAVGSGLLLIIISILVIRVVRLHAYLTVGWLWYLGTLVPVIGLVQVGTQAMADRYTYVPLIGLFIIIAWGLSCLVARWRYHKIVLAISAVLILSSLSVCTLVQLQYWKNGITLFERALEVTSNNFVAHNNLGNALGRQRRFGEAVQHFLEALRIRPGYAHALNNLAATLAHQGKFEEAIVHYTEALRIRPEFEEAHINLGIALTHQGRFEDAIKHYQEALRIKPDYPEAHFYLALAFSSMGDNVSALKEYEILKSINPNLAKKLLGRISKGPYPSSP